MRRSQALGAYGEEVAVAHLRRGGLEILDRNWRCEVGELDIVACDAATLVVVEVKTRSSTAFGHPAEAVSPRKLKRLRQLTFRWLVAHEQHAPSVRIDVITVIQGPAGPPSVEHLRGVS